LISFFFAALREASCTRRTSEGNLTQRRKDAKERNCF
jgi:hypothetical protein